MTNQPLSIVIRIPNVKLSQLELETALGMPLDRYDEATASRLAYAQIDVPDVEDLWAAACKSIECLRDAFRRLLSEESIGPPLVDLAITLPSSALSTSLTIPPALATVAGSIRMDIEVSIYRSEAEVS